MPITYNKIYRGGVQRTTPETRQANAPTTGTLLPGTAVTLTAAAGGMTLQKGIVALRTFFYFVGEQLHGSVNDDQVGGDSSVRLYTPRSGDLYAGRAVAGLALVDDLALAIDANGRLAAAVADGPVHCYADVPASEHPGAQTPTTLDQLIPVKIK